MRSGSSSQCRRSGAGPAGGRQTQDGQCDRGGGPGRLTIVSLGPGFLQYLVPAALDALNSADVLVGYKMYLDLIGDLIAGKKTLASGMRKEVERCNLAIDQALAGNRVALVSSGDAGIYGMAGLVFDLCRERNLRIERSELVGLHFDSNADPAQEERGGGLDLWIDVVPGVPAFNAASAVLGAPLMHDFAAVSLSDHLTPWELIEKRLTAVATADFVLAIYNPRSKTRPHGLQRAVDLLLQHRPATTPVGIVGRAMRDGQWSTVTTLGEIPFADVDMQSMVIVGNSRTYLWQGWMVTPRGYLDKYTLEGEPASAEE
ncbi:MAG TPA: precorrin-3B C(17)-methyltransferase [Syntrophobacteraceae bacterium]|nr:precorrin-3B C(17)-methyltransferase [Syntrophobacteraceae bacterium]